jgi:hypothetical protein
MNNGLIPVQNHSLQALEIGTLVSDWLDSLDLRVETGESRSRTGCNVPPSQGFHRCIC